VALGFDDQMDHRCRPPNRCSPSLHPCDADLTRGHASGNSGTAAPMSRLLCCKGLMDA
jgi:hypothetical protein